jgi:hypothetical protein
MLLRGTDGEPSLGRGMVVCLLGGLGALADADLAHLDGATSPGQFHQDPPLISPPACWHQARL